MLGSIDNKDKKIEKLTNENILIKQNLEKQGNEIKELKEIIKELRAIIKNK
ncbi:hypothetical protein [Sneathia sanguinegens]|nr:hypothetical protein [Sneathia sanguinegens]